MKFTESVKVILLTVILGLPLVAGSVWSQPDASDRGGASPAARPSEKAAEQQVLLLEQSLEQARQLDSKGQYEQAESFYRDALEIGRDLQDKQESQTGDILLDLALNLSNQGRFDVSDGVFRQAEAVLQQSSFDADRARLAQYLGYHLANQGQFSNARRASQQASELWQKLVSGSGASRSVSVDGQESEDRFAEQAELAMALNFQAKMSLRDNEIFTAQALAGEALQVFSRTKGMPPHWRASILQTLGEVSIAQRRTSAAETYFKLAYDLRQEVFGVSRPTVQTLAELGRAYQSDGLETSAIITFRKAFSEAKSLSDSQGLFTSEQLLAFGGAVVDYSKRLKTQEELFGLYAEAFDAFQFNRSSVLDQTIQKAKRRLEIEDPQLKARLDGLDQSFRAMTAVREEIRNLQDKGAEQGDEARLQKLRADFERLHQKWVSEQTSMAQDYPQLTASTSVPALQLQDVRSQLGPQEGLINFIVGRNFGVVQLIRREGSWLARVDAGRDELAERVKTLRRALEVQSGTILDFDLVQSYELYQLLLEDLEPQLKDLTHLIMVPDGPLSSLPMSVLVTAKPNTSGYEQAEWLNKRFALSQAPSIASLINLRTIKRGARPSKALLAFGDPVLLGPQKFNLKTAMQNGLNGAQDLASKVSVQSSQNAEICRPDGPMPAKALLAMAPLPDTAQELTQIASLFPAGQGDVYLGQQATELAFRRQNLSDYKVIYLATHGLLPQELKCQAEPGLVLTPPQPQSNDRANDGLLDASEIATLGINADLVVLSACNTAGAGKLGGEALTGLSEAFFFSGARSLVVSHWQVPSGATARLMTQMFSGLAGEGLGPAEALRRAQIQLSAQTDSSHPFFWGAFVVAGDGREVQQ